MSNKRKILNSALGDTEYMLEQWGLWRSSDRGVPHCVSSMQILMRDHVPESGRRSHHISDELAMLIDGCLARLCLREKGRTQGPLMGDSLWLYFGAKWPAARVGRHYGVSEAKAREVIKAGVAWIDCALEMVREAA